ncbi:hypothetical protein P152DRAFT_469844 [Eremomyces bilateralis CBS 781.70]|uniref:Zn(2)-C6 fungal-type domain-containing protein n=1 Tax=Eremomyces bilateralis CBS 781.70 TaxID=1392243 RepID=A0A6G1GHB8_9PEZI|nr:uncharacterized protein P152DRAFT_469844 [Eremomyces bilateralis CBS 781.70]KAF1817404.1 hypothetical protein P152DRAFT_469844 [Eremomyces bilateralis CBS 781.70]
MPRLASRSDPFTFPDASDLMVLETPLLRVSRPVAACMRCRTAKIRCDGKLPACTSCERANKAAECSSTNDQFAKGKERSYVATLESKVEKLEKRLMEASARRKSSTITMIDLAATPRRVSAAANVGGVAGADRSNPQDKRAAIRKEASNIDDLVSDFGLLAVNSTARDFYGFTSSMTYARLILSAAAQETLPSGMTKALPQKFEAVPLVQHYLNTLGLVLPFFEETSFYASMDNVYQPEATRASPFDRFLVRMVLAIASASMSDQRGDTPYLDALGHLCEALEDTDGILHPGSLQSIQAMLLLAVYATFDPHHFDSWTLVGAASRAMVDLGIHQDPSKSVKMPKQKLELRRRIFYCVYALDRSTALVQTRAFSFSDDSAQVAFPFQSRASASVKKDSPPSPLWQPASVSALEYFRLRQIQSRWYTLFFQSGRTPMDNPYAHIWQTYHEMTAWYDGLSPNIPTTVRQIFHLELLYSYVYLLSPSARCPAINSYAQRLIFEHCIAYASKIASIVATIQRDKKAALIPLTFYDAMRVYMTGRQFIDVLARSPTELLNPIPPTPPAVLAPSPPGDDGEIDPLAPATEIAPPRIPDPYMDPPHATSAHSTGSAFTINDPTTRSTQAIQDFTDILSYFGVRFGFISWRDRFSRESAPLLATLLRQSQQNEASANAMGVGNMTSYAGMGSHGHSPNHGLMQVPSHSPGQSHAATNLPPHGMIHPHQQHPQQLMQTHSHQIPIAPHTSPAQLSPAQLSPAQQLLSTSPGHLNPSPSHQPSSSPGTMHGFPPLSRATSHGSATSSQPPNYWRHPSPHQPPQPPQQPIYTTSPPPAYGYGQPWTGNSGHGVTGVGQGQTEQGNASGPPMSMADPALGGMAGWDTMPSGNQNTRFG